MTRDYSAESVDNKYRKYHYEFDSFSRERLLRRLDPYIRDGASLEVGAYKGVMTEMLIRFCNQLTVVEASADLAKNLAERFPEANVQHSLIEEWESSQLFENIFLVHTLEHIENRVSVLRDLRDRLTPQGRLFVAVPNANALSRRIAVEMGLMKLSTEVTEGEAQHGHHITYNHETLRRDLLAAGLHVEHSGGVVVKTMANFQIDAAIAEGIISLEYLEACDRLAEVFPDLSASIFAVCSKQG